MSGELSVLYVDDDHALLEIGKLFLEQSGYFTVETLASAQAALSLLDTNKFDAIVSDYQMPGMDGIELLKRVRASGNSIPFIIFTGRGREEIVIQALNEGANFYLQKGGDPNAQFVELTHKIQMSIDHHRAADKIQVLNRLYSVLSATNKAIFHIRTKSEFFYEICRILVEIGGFRMAWIGLADHEHRIIRPVVSAGYVDGYLDSVDISTEDIPRGRGPTGAAFRSGKYFFSNDITTDPKMEPWRANALERGYLANAAFPFALGTKNAGVLSLYAPVTGFFDHQIIELLEELAADISFSLGTIDDQAERKRAVEELQMQNIFTDAVLNSIPGLFYLYDEEGHLIRWNKNHETVTGYSADELAGMHLLDWYNGDARDTETITKGAERALSAGYAEAVANLTTKSGKKIPFYFTAVKLEIAGRKYFTGIGIDITRRKQVEEALRATGARLSFALRSARAGTWDWDFLTGKLAWSPEFLDLFGLPPDSPPSFETWLASLHPDDRTPAMEKINQSVQEHRDLWNEYRVLLPGGVLRWIGASGSTTYGDTGEPLRMSGVCIDITDKKRVEDELLRKNEELWASYEEMNATNEELCQTMNELAASEQLFRSLFGMMQNGFAVHEIICDENGTPRDYRFIDMNPAFERMTGLLRENLIGKTVTEVLPGIEPVWIERYGRVALTGSADHFEDYSGDLGKTYEVTVYQNAYAQFTTVISDVTERKQVEAELSASEEALSAMLNGITEAAFLMTPEGTILAANETVARRLGKKSTEDLIGQNAFSLLPPDVQKNRQMKIQEILESGKPVHFEDIRNGRVIDQTIYPVHAPDGAVHRLAVFGMDTTERKQTEEALKEVTARLRERMKELDCLISVSSILADPNIEIERAISQILRIIPPAWQYPEITGVKITLDGREYPDHNFRTTSCMMDQRILAGGKEVGIIEIVYLEEKPECYEGPFLAEERKLIESIAEELGKFTERKYMELALRENERHFKDFFEQDPNYCYMISPDGRILDLNQAAVKCLGYSSRDELIGKQLIPTIYSPESQEKSRLLFARWKETGTVQNEEMVIRTKTGENRTVLLNVNTVYAPDGTPDYSISIQTDITERKRAEAALAASEEQYRFLAENAGDVIWLLDLATGKFTYVSPSVRKLRGLSPDEALLQSIKDAITPESYAMIAEQLPVRLAEFAAGNESLRVQTQMIDQVRKDGTIVPTEVVSTLLTNQEGTAITVLGVSRDITDRKMAEEALRESELRYRGLFENMLEGFAYCRMIYDETGHPADFIYLNVNPAFERITRTAAVIGKPVTEVFPGIRQAMPGLIEAYGRVASTGEPESFDINFRPIEKWLHVSVYSPAKEYFVAIFDDISEHKQLEMEMKYHEEELRQFSSALGMANKKLTLLSSITRHDINNQLTVLMGYLELMEMKQPDSSYSDYFNKISNAAERIQAMIQFTKTYEGIGVNAPVLQNARLMVETASKDIFFGDILLVNDIPADLAVFADPLIVKVFFNLMDNAVRYGGKITTLRFSAEKYNDEVIIVCEDDGNGIPPADKEKIFERGFGKNTGLGLFLSREILGITGITIAETGVPGKGARFEMMVPKGMYR